MDVYEIVTSKIIEQLENGVIPWHKPWHGTKEGAFNRITKKPYSIINQMLLKNKGEYATFKQWSELGGTIKKGAKSEIVVFWKLMPYEDTKSTLVNGVSTEEKVIKNIPILRYYNVFHISQVEGVEPLKEWEQPKELDPIERADRIIENYSSKDHLKIIKDQKSNRAFYSPMEDYVQVPCLSQYEFIEEYYSTFFHELTHSTKHETRLNRGNECLSFFGGEEYSKEELVAEIGASSMLNYLGISTDKAFKNSVAYIQSWLQVLKNDKKFVISASSKAQKAMDYILSFTEEEKEDEGVQ